MVANTSAPTTQTDASNGASPSGATPPLSTLLPFERVTLSTLGLGTPLSSDDFSALIADLQSKLDKATKQQRDQRVNEAAARTSAILAAVTALKQQISDDTGAINAATAQQQVDKANETQYLSSYNYDVSSLANAVSNASATLSNDTATLNKIPQYLKDSKGKVTTQLNPAWVNQNNVVKQDAARLTALQDQYQATQDYKAEVDANYRGDTQNAQKYAAAVSADLGNAQSALNSAGLSSTGYEGTVTQAEQNYDAFNAARVDYDKQQNIINAKTAEVASDSVAIGFLLSTLATADSVVDPTQTSVEHNLDLVRDLGSRKTDDLVKDFSARMAAVIDRVALLSLLRDKPVDASPPPVDGTSPPVDGNQAPVNGNPSSVNGNQGPADGNQPPVDGSPAPTDGTQPPVGGTQLNSSDSPAPVEDLSVPVKAAVATLLAAVSDVLSAVSETLSAGQYKSQAALLNNERVTIPG